MDLTLGHTGRIILAAQRHGATLQQTAYLLATAYHETAHTMQPIKETERKGVSRTDAEVVAVLEKAFTRGQLPWVKTRYWTPDAEGRSWFGRGFVQLTHRVNYERASVELGRDLLECPARAMDPEIAAEVLVLGSLQGWFTGKRLGSYVAEGRAPDYVAARAVINGKDKAAEIAALALKYAAALRDIPLQVARPFRAPSSPAAEAEVEALIVGKGLTAPRLTPEGIDAVIAAEAYHVFPNTTLTVCALTLRNGFVVTGESAAASPENFDAEIGRKIARDNARARIWALEGYLLRERLFQEV